MKRYVRLIIGIVLVALGVVIIFNGQKTKQCELTAQFGDRSLCLEVAASPEDRTLGLGKRDSLARDSGMLFRFEHPGHHGIWMKDMRFPLDILWLDAGKNVVHIERTISPDTFDTVFYPTTPATYVIEVNAGDAAAAGVDLNNRISF